MKILVTESQYKKILREEKEQKIFRVPGLDFFHENPWEAWKILQKVLEVRGNPPYSIGGNLDLEDSPIKSLGNLTSVGRSLNLRYTPIESLGNLQSVGGDLDLQNISIESLENLTSVGSDLDLENTPIKSLGKLKSVGLNLFLKNTPLSKKYTKDQIRQMVDIGGNIYL
jgi:hypothetical protein